MFRRLQWRCGSIVACHRVRDTDCSSLGRHAGRPDYMEGTQPHPSAENWIKDLLSMALPTSTRLAKLFPTANQILPHSQSLASGNLHKPLILFHERADRMKTTITEN